MYTKQYIKENFEILLNERSLYLKTVLPSHFLKVINIDNIHDIGLFLIEDEKQNKIRDNYKHKVQILCFFDKLIEIKDTEGSRSRLKTMQRLYLLELKKYLSQKHNFKNIDGWGLGVFLTSIFDLLLILIGVAKYYYYYPIFLTLYIVRKIIIYFKAKKTNKYTTW